jgi:hypothetical protein
MKCLFSLVIAAGLTFATLPSLADDDEARNLYVEQMNKPTQHINSGIAYWLELSRAGKVTHVSNKKTFHNGDKLRLHMKPNFNGYAYILMLEASQGDHYVLFPTKKFPNNKITAGRDIALPVGNGAPAWMKFDKNPGDEVIRVVVSRNKIDPKSQFKKDDDTVVIASSGDDTVPEGNSVSVDTRDLTVEQAPKSKHQLSGQVTVVGHNPQKLLSVDIKLNHQI